MADQGKYTRVPESNDTTRAAMDYFSNLARILSQIQMHPVDFIMEEKIPARKSQRDS